MLQIHAASAHNVPIGVGGNAGEDQVVRPKPAPISRPEIDLGASEADIGQNNALQPGKYDVLAITSSFSFIMILKVVNDVINKCNLILSLVSGDRME